MQEQTKEALAKASTDAINKLGEWVRNAESFAKEQAPQLAEEILKWGYYSNLVRCIISGLGLILAIILMYRFIRIASKSNWECPQLNNLGCIIGILVVGTVSLSSLAPTFSNSLQNLIFITCAPRLYIIKEIADLVK